MESRCFSFRGDPADQVSMKRTGAALLAVALAVPAGGCRDVVKVYSHPPGAELVVDGRPYGPVPEAGLPVDVKWWTFSRHHATLSWPGGQSVAADFRKSVGDPRHPEYLVLDGILAIFFLVPGVIAFCVNGVGPEPEQHFYAPRPSPVPEEKPAPLEKSPERKQERPVPEPTPDTIPEG